MRQRKFFLLQLHSNLQYFIYFPMHTPAQLEQDVRESNKLAQKTRILKRMCFVMSSSYLLIRTLVSLTPTVLDGQMNFRWKLFPFHCEYRESKER